MHQNKCLFIENNFYMESCYVKWKGVALIYIEHKHPFTYMNYVQLCASI